MPSNADFDYSNSSLYTDKDGELQRYQLVPTAPSLDEFCALSPPNYDAPPIPPSPHTPSTNPTHTLYRGAKRHATPLSPVPPILPLPSNSWASMPLPQTPSRRSKRDAANSPDGESSPLAPPPSSPTPIVPKRYRVSSSPPSSKPGLWGKIKEENASKERDLRLRASRRRRERLLYAKKKAEKKKKGKGGADPAP